MSILFRSAAGLNLNLLNGTTADFSLLPINVTTSSQISILKNVEIGLSGTLAIPPGALIFNKAGLSVATDRTNRGSMSVFRSRVWTSTLMRRPAGPR